MITISKSNTFFKTLLFSLLCVCSLVTAPLNKELIPLASAQSAAGPQLTASAITISPPSYELTSNPGDVIQNVIKVTNSGNSSTTFEAVVEDFRVEGDEGVVRVGKDDNPNAFSSWFTTTPESITLKKDETKEITFVIRVPDDAEPGGHFASVMFQPKAIASESQSGAQVLQRVGSLILMTVSGDIKENGAVGKFSTKTYVGSYDTLKFESDADKEYLRPTNEKLEQEKEQIYFDKGPMAFELVLQNSGNVFFRPREAKIVIKNIFGQTVDEINVEPKNVFPGGERRMTVIWPRENLWGIRYTADFTAIYGQKSPKTLSTTTTFWAFPTTALAIIVVVLVLIILLRKRLIKAFKILAAG